MPCDKKPGSSKFHRPDRPNRPKALIISPRDDWTAWTILLT